MSVRHLKLSARARSIGPSPTLAMNKRAAELIAVGLDILPLSLGEPDFDTPAEVKLAGIRAIEQNFTKYTAAGGTGSPSGAPASPREPILSHTRRVSMSRGGMRSFRRSYPSSWCCRRWAAGCSGWRSAPARCRWWATCCCTSSTGRR